MAVRTSTEAVTKSYSEGLGWKDRRKAPVAASFAERELQHWGMGLMGHVKYITWSTYANFVGFSQVVLKGEPTGTLLPIDISKVRIRRSAGAWIA